MEVKGLERSKAKAEEVSIRLNKELNDVKVKHQESKVAMQKEHKIEEKFLKKDIGRLVSENTKLKKAADGTSLPSKAKSSKKTVKMVSATGNDSGPIDEESKYDPTEVICTLCEVVILDYKPKYFQELLINHACNKCEDSDYEDDTIRGISIELRSGSTVVRIPYPGN